MPEVKLQFTREKETPGTIRFKEQGADTDIVSGSFYVKKPKMDLLDNADELELVVRPKKKK